MTTPYNPRRSGEASYNKWTTVDAAGVPAGASGAPNGEYFAQLVHVTNSLELSAGDISIGAVEIKDGTTGDRVSVIPFTTNNAIAIISVDDNGDPIDSIQTYGIYETSGYQNLDGTATSDSTSAYGAKTLIRLQSWDNDNWIKRTAGAGTAVTLEGLLLPNGSEITMEINSGDVISTIGGKLNVVPIIN